MSVETRNLGLAAYMKMQGAVLTKFISANRVFVFDSDETETDWNIKYLNSESYKHDSELINLRKLFQ